MPCFCLPTARRCERGGPQRPAAVTPLAVTGSPKPSLPLPGLPVLRANRYNHTEAFLLSCSRGQVTARNP